MILMSKEKVFLFLLYNTSKLNKSVFIFCIIRTFCGENTFLEKIILLLFLYNNMALRIGEMVRASLEFDMVYGERVRAWHV
jgi:hypothetical protein